MKYTNSFHFFRPPKSDKCNICCETDELLLKHANEPHRVAEIQETKRLHKAEADLRKDNMYRHINMDHEEYVNDPTWLNLCTDLMQMLPLPKLSNQSAYFKTKVWFRFVFIIMYYDI